MNPLNSEQAILKLKEGNERFLSKKYGHPNQSAERQAEVVKGQHPFAAILTCSDSRVPPEILFDQGIGDLFIIRVAGNILTEEIMGSIEYAVTVLSVPLIVVLGHDSCGAVKATITALDDGAVPGGFVRDIVERVTPEQAAAAASSADIQRRSRWASSGQAPSWMKTSSG